MSLRPALPIFVLIAPLSIFAAARPASQDGTTELSRNHRPSVLLVTLDTVRADHLGCYGYSRIRTPALDGLASEGVRFARAYVQVPITLPSHVVILSGTYPMWNGVRDFTTRGLSPDVGLLAEAFERHGYATAAFVSAFVLDSSWGLKRGFQVYDDQFDPRQFETQNPGNIQRRGGETVDHLLGWLKSQATGVAAARPFFVWLHLYDPHSPYDPPEPFRTRYASHPYDGEIAYADSQLGRVFDYLRQAELYDPALVVFVSDHGESLGEHGEDEHGFFLYRSTLQVPLIVKLPRSSRATSGGRVVRVPVGTIDLAPTLLEVSHLEDPLRRQFQGQSLAPLVLGKTTVSDRPVYSETYYPRNSFGWSPLRSISTSRYSYVEAPRRELYDAIRDGAEAQNLYEERSADGLALHSQLLDLERRYTRASLSALAAASPLSAETLEKLRSLGYVAYAAPPANGGGGNLADPKDRLGTFKSILRAEDLAAAGKFDRSDALLGSLRSSEPDLYLVPFMLGENALKERHWLDAERELLACLKLNPSFEQAVMGLARVTLAQDKLDQAHTWLKLAVSQNPRNFLAYFGLGLVAQKQNRTEEARNEFEKSIREKPNYAPSQQALGVMLVETRNYPEALEPLRRASELAEQNPAVWNYLGTAYANTGDSRNALKSYQKALSLKGDYAAARLNLAFAYQRTGDATRARREFGLLCSQDRTLCRQYQKFFQ
jgi:choline-sulfatase